VRKGLEAVDFVKEKLRCESFDVAVVAGSGVEVDFPAFAEVLYADVPGMPSQVVEGHKGVLKACSVAGKKVLLFQGRFHYYEGRTDSEMRFIPELAYRFGVRAFISTCASGAVSRRVEGAEFGVVVDHLNLMGRNPLTGLVARIGSEVFFDPKSLYNRKLCATFLDAGKSLGLKVVPVVLAGVAGPCYETQAELRFLEMCNVDCVSMSTIPECLYAGFLGMKVAALALLTNRAVSKTSHGDVLKASKALSPKLTRLLYESVRRFSW
jgi:purine-nucleoside phosphorylase